jgi:predicted anti-sigma-YlaC factor YlaD
MMLWRKTMGCDRAAQLYSLELDGELSELERARLAKHLESCASCRAWSADVARFTSLIRAAPPVAPAATAAVLVPRARSKRRAAAVLASVAAAAAAAAVIALPQAGQNKGADALGFRDARQQQRFAQEHVRTELALFAVPPAPPPSSFAARALL